MTAFVLLVDMQQDFLNEAGLEPHRNAVVAGASRLLAAARAKGVRVIHIHTTVVRDPDNRMLHWKVAGRWSCVAGTGGHAVAPGLEPTADETVLHKSGFGVGAAALRAAAGGCEHAIVAGVHLHACVRQAVLDLSEAGIAASVAREGCGSADPGQAANAELYLRARSVAYLAEAEVLACLDDIRPRSVNADARVRAVLRSPRRSSARIASLLPGAADALEAGADALARGITAEIGKPVRHARNEVARTAALLRMVARRFDEDRLAVAGPEALVRRQPLGRVAVITPWNNPLAIAAGQIAPALAYGNDVIWKAAPAAPETSASFHRLMLAAGVGGDTLRLLIGDGDLGRALVVDPSIDAVCFTGSTATGRLIAAVCSARFMPLQAELGGNNAVIVTATADLPRAARIIAAAAFGCAGQRCTASRRVIVDNAVYDEFLGLLSAATAELVVGDPNDDATDVGPMLNTTRANVITAYVERAGRDGHAILKPHGEISLGAAYHLPTIIACNDRHAEIVQTETFGPVLVVQRADDFDDALALLNDVRHGLVAAMFGGDPAQRAQFLAQARAGMLKFDQATVEAGIDVPFGGWKASGIGPPQHGTANREFFSRAQTVYGDPRG